MHESRNDLRLANDSSWADPWCILSTMKIVAIDASNISHEDDSYELSLIGEAIKLHDEVFSLKEKSRYNDKNEWVKRIQNGGYFVACVDGQKMKGFAICDVTPEGEFKIWLAGVDKSERGKGIWLQIYQEIIFHAKEESYESILLNTFPEKFPEMFSFLQKINAEIYKKEEVGGFNKVYARIKV